MLRYVSVYLEGQVTFQTVKGVFDTTLRSDGQDLLIRVHKGQIGGATATFLIIAVSDPVASNKTLRIPRAAIIE